MVDSDPNTLLAWLHVLDGEERDLQLIALEQLCMLLLVSDNIDRCFESCPPRTFIPALCAILLDHSAPAHVLEVTARALACYLDVAADCSHRIVSVPGAVGAICACMSRDLPHAGCHDDVKLCDQAPPTSSFLLAANQRNSVKINIDLIEQCIKLLELLCEREARALYEAGTLRSVLNFLHYCVRTEEEDVGSPHDTQLTSLLQHAAFTGAEHTNRGHSVLHTGSPINDQIDGVGVSNSAVGGASVTRVGGVSTESASALDCAIDRDMSDTHSAIHTQINTTCDVQAPPTMGGVNDAIGAAVHQRRRRSVTCEGIHKDSLHSALRIAATLCTRLDCNNHSLTGLTVNTLSVLLRHVDVQISSMALYCYVTVVNCQVSQARDITHMCTSHLVQHLLTVIILHSAAPSRHCVTRQMEHTATTSQRSVMTSYTDSGVCDVTDAQFNRSRLCLHLLHTLCRHATVSALRLLICHAHAYLPHIAPLFFHSPPSPLATLPLSMCAVFTGGNLRLLTHSRPQSLLPLAGDTLGGAVSGLARTQPSARLVFADVFHLCEHITRLLFDGGAELAASVTSSQCSHAWCQRVQHAPCTCEALRGAIVRDEWTRFVQLCVSAAAEQSLDISCYVDQFGQTLLNWASAYGRVEMVRYLCGIVGVDPNLGYLSSLHYAVIFNHVHVLDVLLDSGRVDVCSRDRFGRSIADLLLLKDEQIFNEMNKVFVAHDHILFPAAIDNILDTSLSVTAPAATTSSSSSHWIISPYSSRDSDAEFFSAHVCEIRALYLYQTLTTLCSVYPFIGTCEHRHSCIGLLRKLVGYMSGHNLIHLSIISHVCSPLSRVLCSALDTESEDNRLKLHALHMVHDLLHRISSRICTPTFRRCGLLAKISALAAATASEAAQSPVARAASSPACTCSVCSYMCAPVSAHTTDMTTMTHSATTERCEQICATRGRDACAGATADCSLSSRLSVDPLYSQLTVHRPYLWHSVSLCLTHHSLYLWSSHALIELSLGSNGWFRYLFSGSSSTEAERHTEGDTEGGSPDGAVTAVTMYSSGACSLCAHQMASHTLADFLSRPLTRVQQAWRHTDTAQRRRRSQPSSTRTETLASSCCVYPLFVARDDYDCGTSSTAQQPRADQVFLQVYRAGTWTVGLDVDTDQLVVGHCHAKQTIFISKRMRGFVFECNEGKRHVLRAGKKSAGTRLPDTWSAKRLHRDKTQSHSITHKVLLSARDIHFRYCSDLVSLTDRQQSLLDVLQRLHELCEPKCDLTERLSPALAHLVLLAEQLSHSWSPPSHYDQVTCQLLHCLHTLCTHTPALFTQLARAHTGAFRTLVAALTATFDSLQRLPTYPTSIPPPTTVCDGLHTRVCLRLRCAQSAEVVDTILHMSQDGRQVRVDALLTVGELQLQLYQRLVRACHERAPGYMHDFLRPENSVTQRYLAAVSGTPAPPCDGCLHFVPGGVEERGLLYWLGSCGGRRVYQNPASIGLITVCACSDLPTGGVSVVSEQEACRIVSRDTPAECSVVSRDTTAECTTGCMIECHALRCVVVDLGAWLVPSACTFTQCACSSLDGGTWGLDVSNHVTGEWVRLPSSCCVDEEENGRVILSIKTVGDVTQGWRYIRLCRQPAQSYSTVSSAQQPRLRSVQCTRAITCLELYGRVTQFCESLTDCTQLANCLTSHCDPVTSDDIVLSTDRADTQIEPGTRVKLHVEERDLVYGTVTSQQPGDCVSIHWDSGYTNTYRLVCEDSSSSHPVCDLVTLHDTQCGTAGSVAHTTCSLAARRFASTPALTQRPQLSAPHLLLPLTASAGEQTLSADNITLHHQPPGGGMFSACAMSALDTTGGDTDHASCGEHASLFGAAFHRDDTSTSSTRGSRADALFDRLTVGTSDGWAPDEINDAGEWRVWSDCASEVFWPPLAEPSGTAAHDSDSTCYMLHNSANVADLSTAPSSVEIFGTFVNTCVTQSTTHTTSGGRSDSVTSQCVASGSTSLCPAVPGSAIAAPSICVPTTQDTAFSFTSLLASDLFDNQLFCVDSGRLFRLSQDSQPIHPHSVHSELVTFSEVLFDSNCVMDPTDVDVYSLMDCFLPSSTEPVSASNPFLLQSARTRLTCQKNSGDTAAVRVSAGSNCGRRAVSAARVTRHLTTPDQARVPALVGARHRCARARPPVTVLRRRCGALLPPYDPRPGRSNVSQTEELDLNELKRRNKQQTVEPPDLWSLRLRIVATDSSTSTSPSVTICRHMARDTLYACLHRLLPPSCSTCVGASHTPLSAARDIEATLMLEYSWLPDDTDDTRHMCHSPNCPLGGTTVQQQTHTADTADTSHRCQLPVTLAEVLLPQERVLCCLLSALSDSMGDSSDPCWHAAKLGQRLWRQLGEALVVAAGCLPDWCLALQLCHQRLFDAPTRIAHFRATAFGVTRAIEWLQSDCHDPWTSVTEPRHLTSAAAATLSQLQSVDQLTDTHSDVAHANTPSGPLSVLLQPPALSALMSAERSSAISLAATRTAQQPLGVLRIKHERFTAPSRVTIQNTCVSRDHRLCGGQSLLDWSRDLMFAHSHSRCVLEVQFAGEAGTGLGPTLEFYTQLACDLQQRHLCMWLSADVSCDSAATCTPRLVHVDSTSDECGGLFPAPIPQDSVLCDRVTELFRFFGVLVGKTLQDHRLLDMPLSDAFLKLISTKLLLTDLHHSVSESSVERVCQTRVTSSSVQPQWPLHVLSLDDLATIDPQRHSSYQHLLHMSASELEAASLHYVFYSPCASLGYTSFVLTSGGDRETDLTSGGDRETALTSGGDRDTALTSGGDIETALTSGGDRDTALTSGGDRDTDLTSRGGRVTADNVHQYVSDCMQFMLGDGISRQMRAFRDGLSCVCDIRRLCVFDVEELRTLICGEQCPQWTAEELLTHLQPGNGFTTHSRSFTNLVSILVEMSGAQRKQFLRFSTGSSSLPVGGLSRLAPPLTVVRKTEAGDSSLPSVNTCVHYLKLPDYSSVHIMRQRLLAAINEAGFHLN